MHFNSGHATSQKIKNNISPFLFCLVIKFNIYKPAVMDFVMPYINWMPTSRYFCTNLKKLAINTIEPVLKPLTDSKKYSEVRKPIVR